MSIIAAAVFAAVASPQVFKLTRSVAGGWVATSEGTAKIGGLILHAIVFVLLLRLAMRILKPKKSGYQYGRSNLWGGAYSQTTWGGLPTQIDDRYPIDGKVDEN
jgi:hypothetical protein